MINLRSVSAAPLLILSVRQTQGLEVNAVFLRTQQVFLPTPNAEPVYRSA